MRFDVISLFPGIFDSFLQQSLLKLAIKRKLVEVHLWNLRDWSTDQHLSVDDKPFGGGPGMLLSCQPLFDAVEEVQSQGEAPGQLVMLTPQGSTLKQPVVRELSQLSRLVFLCGRYEGFDERIRIGLNPLEISVGDFITNGGEVPTMLMIETIIRLVPDVLGDAVSHQLDSFSGDGLLEHPQYTRPRVFRGMQVPEVLLSGDHQAIAQWRIEQSLKRTNERRPDLLD